MQRFFAAFGAASVLWSAAVSQTLNAEDIDAKVDALIEHMTIEEKVGQLTQFNGFWDVTGPAPTGREQQKKFDIVEAGLVGSMLNVIGTDDVKTIQDYAVQNSRLGIPVIFGYDVIHGHETIFPLPLAEAASWDMRMIEKTARVAAVEAAAQGQNWTFAPMVDVSRDARWGRVMEGAGEDPYLGSKIAIARVQGFQGDDLSAPDTIAATLKHLAAYGFAESGKDYNAAEIGTVTLFNTVLPPFKAGIDHANARTVMNAFNTVNGIPATADKFLQRDILKGAWGFDGFVISDWGSASEMIDHGFAADEVDAARLAINAGSDMDMESYVYLDHLADLVASGDVKIDDINDAVRRVLRVKFELGLFDDPYRYIDPEREADMLMTDEHRMIAREMAERSVVLLKNEGGLLPLDQSLKVAVIGALAADKDSPLGNWRAQGDANSAVSLIEGFEQAGLDFQYAEGVALQIGDAGFPDEVQVNVEDRSGIAEAVNVAQNADVVVLVVGEDALQSGEGRSRAGLGLPGLQQELAEAVVEANPFTVMVVMSGRPLVLTWADNNIPAIVQAWHLGHESGHALTNVLTGRYNPSGKLPMTFPRSVGQVPIYYNHLSTGRPGPKDEVFWSHYIDESNVPLYPFGHGLSYTTFDYSRLRLRQREDDVEVSITVRNSGSLAGEEVVQVYIRDRAASVSRPVRELKGFDKIALEPGERRDIAITLTPEELGFYNTSGQFVIESGVVDVFVGGSSSADLTRSIDYRVN
ncbi:MAG: beta-glucosidase BglX [Pseudomonadota bacterium]